MEQNTHSTFESIVRRFTEWRKFFFISIVGCTLLSLITAFVIPVQFKSIASVLPAEQTDLFGSIEGISNIAKSFSSGKGLSMLKGNEELDRYMAILKSGRVLSNVIQKFDLVTVYDITSYPIEKTTKELLSNVEFVVEDEGFLSVTVYDEDPHRAAAMANYFIEELNRANSELRAKNATSNRIFIEERYRKNVIDLRAAEDSLTAFQKRYGVIAMPDQAEATIKAGANLAAELVLLEVQQQTQARLYSEDNPTARALQVEIDEMRKKLQSMNSVSSTTGTSFEMNLLVPFAKIPDLGAEFLRRFRDVEIQTKIMQFLTPMYEQSKVEEQRQTPSVIVLDHAMPAERKSRPKRILIVIGGFLLGLVTSLTYVGIRIRWEEERRKQSTLFQALTEMIDSISSDLQRTKTK